MAGVHDFVRRSVLNSLTFSDSFEEPTNSPTHSQRVAADSGARSAAVATGPTSSSSPTAAAVAASSAVPGFETPRQNVARSGSEVFEESESEEKPPHQVVPKKPAAHLPKPKRSDKCLKRPAACLEVKEGQVEEQAASASKAFKRPAAEIESQVEDENEQGNGDPVVEPEKGGGSVRKRPAAKAVVAKEAAKSEPKSDEGEGKKKRVGVNAEYSYKDAAGQWEAGAVGGKQLVLD